MPEPIILTPAYGRDYKTKAAVLADYDAGRDFIIASFGNPYQGKPVNKEQIVAQGYWPVNIRYRRNRALCLVPDIRNRRK